MLRFEQRRSIEKASRVNQNFPSGLFWGCAYLERASYPDEDTLFAELLMGWSVCNESLLKPVSESGDSERGPKGDDKGLGSPAEENQHLTLIKSDWLIVSISIPRAID